MRLPKEFIQDDANPDVQVLKSHLWKDAKIYLDDSVSVVELRKGGYVVAKALEPRRSSRHEAKWLADRGASASFFMRNLERSLLFFLLSTTILVIWISSVVVAPLVKLAHEAERFPEDVRSQRLMTESGPKEVRDLARTLNKMQLRIRAMIKSRSRAHAAISHDLRTIITRVRLRAEFIKDDALRLKMIHDADFMDAMLKKNLQYLHDQRQAADRSLIDLDSVLQTVSDQFIEIGHDVIYHGGGHPLVFGTLVDVQRIFNNLIENGVTYGHKVSIRANDAGPNAIQIDVADDGPGIREEDRLQVLEPFVRGQPGRTLNSRGGFGLGLSIVRSLVEDMGGSLELVDNEPHGLIARVILPCAHAQDHAAERAS